MYKEAIMPTKMLAAKTKAWDMTNRRSCEIVRDIVNSLEEEGEDDEEEEEEEEEDVVELVCVIDDRAEGACERG
jgi:hypothetical protein